MLPSVAWILKIETDSILIKEKCKHLSKTYDRVSKKMKRRRLSLEKEKSIPRSIYRYTKVNSLSYTLDKKIQVLGFESHLGLRGNGRQRKRTTIFYF
jgi:hypothetical protein